MFRPLYRSAFRAQVHAAADQILQGRLSCYGKVYRGSMKIRKSIRSAADAAEHAGQSADGFTRRPIDSWPEEDLQILPGHLRPVKGETLDLILRQKVYLLQSRRGYRANLDSHVLAFFASQVYERHRTRRLRRPLRFLDLGAGNGLVSLLFARANLPCIAHLIELQPELVRRARRNLEINGIEGEVTEHDLAGGSLPVNLERRFDVVLMNPPYYTEGSRTAPRRREKYLSHMETSASLSDFLQAARKAIDDQNPDAFIAVIHDKNESARVEWACCENALRAHNYREVFHTERDAPSRIMIQLKLDRARWASPISSATCTEGKIAPFSLSRHIQPLILHPHGTSPCLYSDEIESHLERLPEPSLRIGRLRDTD